MRNCRKCGELIPNKLIVEGKHKNLQNRKFCLKCSPWKCHNTKPDDPSRNPKIKKNPKIKNPYNEWSNEKKRNYIQKILQRGKDRKDKLIILSGGGCIRCGYSKCKRALVFHHRNPEEKCFGLSINNLWSKTWEVIYTEYNKCELMCMNCHAEIESGF